MFIGILLVLLLPYSISTSVLERTDPLLSYSIIKIPNTQHIASY